MILFSSAPRSLCILRLSAIGDVCHAIAVVQAIQKQWPSTKISWIVGTVEAQLIHDLPGINIVIFDKKVGLEGFFSVWKALKHIRFDALLHMQVSLRSNLLSFGVKAKYKIGFSKNRAKEGQWLLTNKKISETNSFHVLDSFADFARYIGVSFESPSWNIPLSVNDKAFAEKMIVSPALVICPSASKSERNWITERYAALADYAHSKGVNVYLCGSPTYKEIALAKQIELIAKNDIISLVGETSLKQLAAVLAKADIVVSPDSGSAHIATTQNTPIIGLYAHSNPQRTGPYNNLDDVVSIYGSLAKEQHGQPIEQLPWGSRVKGSDLMQGIPLDAVIHRFDSLYQRLSLSSYPSSSAKNSGVEK